MNGNSQNSSVEQMYRAATLVWLALLFSQTLFFALIYFTKPEIFRFDFSRPLLGGENWIMIVTLAFLAMTSAAMSFALKAGFYNRAVNEQRPALIQSGLVVACALCEASALFGVVLAFAFDYQYFFLWIILGILGVLLHFPKRDAFISASYKRGN